MGKRKISSIYHTKTVQDLLQGAKDYEAQLYEDLKQQIIAVRNQDPQRGLQSIGNIKTLRTLLQRYMFDHVVVQDKLNTKDLNKIDASLTLGGYRATLIYQDKNTTREHTIPLTYKQYQEFSSIKKNGGDFAQQVGILYEPSVVKDLTETVATSLQESGRLKSFQKFDVEAGNAVGGIDITIYIPKAASRTPGTGWISRNQLNLDVKSNSKIFGVGSPGDASRSYVTELAKSLREQQDQEAGQMALILKLSLEEVLAINILKWKLEKKYPIFYGATDGGFVLSSELLDPTVGAFEVKFDVDPSVQHKVYQEAEKEAKKRANLNNSIALNIATNVLVNNLQKSELWFSRSKILGGK